MTSPPGAAGGPPERESRPDGEPGAAEISTLTRESETDTSLCQPSAILSAFREDGVLWVWCDHELTWHRHGAGPLCAWGPCDDSCPRCFGRGDGHRSAHCACPESPYYEPGYFVREIGPLTTDVLKRHREVSYAEGCRASSCRLVRRAQLGRRQHPSELPAPTDPFAVAHQVVKGYAAIDYTEPLLDEEWAKLWTDPLYGLGLPAAPDLEYDPDNDGPLALRRWRGTWLRWLRTHWAELEDAELTAELYERLGGAAWVKVAADGKASPQPWKPNRRTVGEVLAAVEGITLLPAHVDAPAWLSGGRGRPGEVVACANGLLDVGTRRLLGHDPDWFNVVSVPFEYDPHAGRPERWLQFLAELWPDEPAAIAALQEWMGYVLSGRTDLQKMLLVVGPPRSGKGTIVRVLQDLVGRGNYAGPTLAALGTNFGLQPLVGKPLAVVADARLGGRDTHVVVERLLSISGEDTLTIDRKYRDPWTGRLPTRVMLLSNELPHFGDASGAIATRFVALQLTRSWLGQEDIDLERTLKRELPGILVWALEGLERLNVQRRFTEPDSSGDAILAMADSASPTGAFVRDRCSVGAGQSVTAAQLYAAWKGWCLENGREHPGNQATFGRTLRSVVPTVRKVRPRDPATGAPTWTYAGIGLIQADPGSFSLSAQISTALPAGSSRSGEDAGEVEKTIGLILDQRGSASEHEAAR